MSEPTYEELKARLADLEKQGQRRSGSLEFRVGEKGGVSVYGLGRFPVTLYYEQWIRLLDAGEKLREFLEENGDEFLGLQQSLARLNSEIENMPSKPEEVFAFSRRSQELQVQLGFLMESEEKNTVFWIERRRTGRESEHLVAAHRWRGGADARRRHDAPGGAPASG